MCPYILRRLIALSIRALVPWNAVRKAYENRYKDYLVART